MPTTIEYSNNPNEETAFVTPEGGRRTRTVLTASVEGSVKYPDNPNSTKVSVTVDGVARKAVAVYNLNGGGGGGSDPHNLGWYATESALTTAHPTATAGDWAIVGSTDTVWVWDTDTSAWVDTDTKGEVTPDMIIVKSATMPTASTVPAGAVYQYVGTTSASYTHGYIYENKDTITYTDSVEFNPASISGTTVTATAGALAGLCEEYGSGNITDIIKGTLTYDQSGDLLVFVGLDDTDTQVCTFQLYTQDYEDAGFTFTGTLQDGDVVAFTCTITENTTYSWERIDVQPAGGGSLPDQTGQSGKYLTTDGTDASWASAPVTSVNSKTGAVTLTATDVGALPDNTHIPADPVQADWDEADSNALDYIKNKPTIPAAQVNSDWDAVSGVAQILNKPSLATVATSGSYSDLINTPSIPAAQVNSDWNSSSGVSEILNKPSLATVATSGLYSDLTGTPTIPSKAADVNAIPQLATLPTADSTNVGQLVQFSGATGTYTNGYFYTSTYDSGAGTYSWVQTDVQPAGGGGSLPSQTGNAGKFLTTDGTDPSWATISALQNTATGTNSLTIDGTAAVSADSVNIGSGSSITYTSLEYGARSVALGSSASADYYGVAIGYNAQTVKVGSVAGYGVAIGGGSLAKDHAVAIGSGAEAKGDHSIAIGKGAKATANYAVMIGDGTNSQSGTIKIKNGTYTFVLVDSLGQIPEDRWQYFFGNSGLYLPTITENSGTKTRAWSTLLDILSTVSGYDATKTQTLKNVAGTLTWVDD